MPVGGSSGRRPPKLPLVVDTSGGMSDATVDPGGTLFTDIKSAVPDAALVAVDRNGVIVEATEAVEQLIGSSSATILHRHLEVFVHPDDRVLTGPNHDERSALGQVSHWTPARIDTRGGWRRVEFASIVNGSRGFVVQLRTPTPPAETDSRAIEMLMLDLLDSPINGEPTSDERTAAPCADVQPVLDKFCDLIAWDRARIRFVDDHVVDLTEVTSRPGNGEPVAPLAGLDARVATIVRRRDSANAARLWSAERDQLHRNGVGSWFRTPIGSNDGAAWLELSHRQENVVLAGWQLATCRALADTLASTWDRWADRPEPATLPDPHDVETRLASWAPLVDELERRLRRARRSDGDDARAHRSRPESVCAFRIHLDGFDRLRSKVGDDAAARVMIAVAHGIGFVLDDSLIGRTGDNELTAIAEIHPGETVDEVVDHIRHEIDESFSWRFEVHPNIRAVAGDETSSATSMLGRARRLV